MKPNNYPVEPKAMWQRFYELTQVPRPSKKEELVREYLIESAKKANLKYRTDEIGNVVIYVPESEGYEDHPTVILQSHMDMVCDKLPDRTFDFNTDPIDVLVEDGWVTADGTTLGADNGFGCAVMLATIDDKTLKHPPLELLFTVDEETGLNGALNVDPDNLSGRTMINIDTEEWGAVYIGCAGGVDMKLTKTAKQVKREGDYQTVRLDIEGLKGGHSGMDIIWGRANAIKLLTSILHRASKLDLGLVEFNAGKAHNIIPRDAYAVVNISSQNIDAFKSIVDDSILEFKEIYPKDDSGLTAAVEVLKGQISKSYSLDVTRDYIKFLTLFPHGAHGLNWLVDEPLVNYSNNLAICRIIGDELYVETSLRFFDRNEAKLIEEQINVLGEEFGVNVSVDGDYPSWKPIFESPLLTACKNSYKELYGTDIKVKAIHAGLECGIIKDRLGEMDAISIGPNLKGVHSPTEAIEISSSSEFWNLFANLLENL